MTQLFQSSCSIRKTSKANDSFSVMRNRARENWGEASWPVSGGKKMSQVATSANFIAKIKGQMQEHLSLHPLSLADPQLLPPTRAALWDLHCKEGISYLLTLFLEGQNGSDSSSRPSSEAWHVVGAQGCGAWNWLVWRPLQTSILEGEEGRKPIDLCVQSWSWLDHRPWRPAKCG